MTRIQILSARKTYGHKGYAGAIVAQAADGKRWMLNRRFRNGDGKDAQLLLSTLERVRAEGSIDPTHWHPTTVG